MMRIERLQDWVTRAAEQRPDATAIVLRDESIDYRGLEETSNRIARALVEAGCAAGDRVALLSPKTPTAIACMLGIYKARGILVPLDDSSPAARLERILRSSGGRFVLAAGGAAGRLLDLQNGGALDAATRVGWLGSPEELARGGARVDFDRADVEALPSTPPVAPAARSTADEPAHIFYTSGSTGEPKGVVVRHSSVIHFIEWAVRHFGIAPGERLSGHSPLPFDLSTLDLYGAFAAQAELHLVPPELNLLPQRLAGFIRETRLTQWVSVPSVLSYMAAFDAVEPDDFPTLRRLIWCGEVFPTPALAYWMRRLPHVGFTNLYGPTEATVASSYYDVPSCPVDETVPVPIGRACDGEELLVLDAELRPTPPGEVGELFLRGVGLSPGYWNDPERTAAAFLPDPFAVAQPAARIYRTGDLARVDVHGVVTLLGRSDAQIKSRGYRIELGEIESAVAALGLTREAVVTAVQTGGFEGYAICCAFSPASPGTGPLELRRALGQLLPSYMMPARWLAFDRLPRNDSGKLDRRRVKEAFLAGEGAERVVGQGLGLDAELARGEAACTP
jgi:amino acid adenylation domain-containing protein